MHGQRALVLDTLYGSCARETQHINRARNDYDLTCKFTSN